MQARTETTLSKGNNVRAILLKGIKQDDIFKLTVSVNISHNGLICIFQDKKSDTKVVPG
jgi:hypothetical protein